MIIIPITSFRVTIYISLTSTFWSAILFYALGWHFLHFTILLFNFKITVSDGHVLSWISVIYMWKSPTSALVPFTEQNQILQTFITQDLSIVVYQHFLTLSSQRFNDTYTSKEMMRESPALKNLFLQLRAVYAMKCCLWSFQTNDRKLNTKMD